MKKLLATKSLLTLFTIIPLLILGLIFIGCSGKIKKDTVVIYLVRHAEKDLTNTTANPPLTAEGEARAQNLIEEFKKVPLAGIHSTSYDRNMNTVAPLAAEKGVDIENYSAHDWHPMLDQMKIQKGSAFLICGHGDNLLPMIDYLNVKRPISELGHLEYDKLFKVTIVDDSAMIEMTIY